MPKGIYRPIANRWKELANPLWLLDNLQVLLAIIAFTLFIALSLWPPIWNFGHMPGKLSLLQWVILMVEAVVFSVSSVIGLIAFLFLMWLIKNGVFGIEIEYDEKNADPKILRAITPIKSKQDMNKPATETDSGEDNSHVNHY